MRDSRAKFSRFLPKNFLAPHFKSKMSYPTFLQTPRLALAPLLQKSEKFHAPKFQGKVLTLPYISRDFGSLSYPFSPRKSLPPFWTPKKCPCSLFKIKERHLPLFHQHTKSRMLDEKGSATNILGAPRKRCTIIWYQVPRNSTWWTKFLFQFPK